MSAATEKALVVTLLLKKELRQWGVGITDEDREERAAKKRAMDLLERLEKDLVAAAAAVWEPHDDQAPPYW